MTVLAGALALLSSPACTQMGAGGDPGPRCTPEFVAASLKLDASAPQRSIGPLATSTVSGTIQYQRYLPTSVPSSKMDYTSVVTRPVRRAIVQIMNGTTVVASGLTNDLGAYSINIDVAAGTSIFVRVQARSAVTAYVKDTLGGADAENCNGGSWDVQVVNNVTNNACSASTASLRPLYVLDGTAFSAPASGTTTKNMTASTLFSAGAYTNRSGAPFALLDTAISALETACQGRAAIDFPVLYMNWSKDNAPVSGNRYAGSISTSFFTTESTAKTANLYILGKASSDTDEFDDHVVAHEFGHFLENKIYRSDSIGGSHSLTDSLDPRLAFGEGFGNAFSGMVHRDPLYIDTSGSLQASGFKIDVSTAPATTDDRGPWSEASMQYMLYTLWNNHSSGAFDRIHNVLENFQKTSSAPTTGLTFASYYASQYGVAGDSLSTIWGTALDSPMNAVCTGACGTTYELFDSDNDLGEYYKTGGGGPRRYRQGGSGSNFTAPFWQIYRPLSSGLNATTTHDQITFGGYTVNSANLNKFGLHRLYTVTATATTTTVSVSSITQAGITCANADLLDMAIYYKGTLLGADETSAGATSSCPSVTFATAIGQTYLVDVIGFGTVGAYTMTVTP